MPSYPALQRLLLNDLVTAEGRLPKTTGERGITASLAGRKQLVEEKRTFQFLLAGIAQ